MAEPNAIKHDKKPRTVSRNKPKNDESIFFIWRYDILQTTKKEKQFSKYVFRGYKNLYL